MARPMARSCVVARGGHVKILIVSCEEFFGLFVEFLDYVMARDYVCAILGVFCGLKDEF